MKGIYFSILFLAAFGFSGCGGNEKSTERTIIESDTISVEKEYEVKNTIEKRTIKVDTVVETETIEVEEDFNGNQ
jgi:hypothetical protein